MNNKFIRIHVLLKVFYTIPMIASVYVNTSHDLICQAPCNLVAQKLKSACCIQLIIIILYTICGWARQHFPEEDCTPTGRGQFASFPVGLRRLRSLHMPPRSRRKKHWSSSSVLTLCKYTSVTLTRHYAKFLH